MQEICCDATSGIKEDAISMTMLDKGSRGTIKGFIMNCEDNRQCRYVVRLKEMGLHLGTQFEVLKNDGNGELVLSFDGSTLALGRGMAEKIAVELHKGTVMEGSFFGRVCRKFGIKCQA